MIERFEWAREVMRDRKLRPRAKLVAQSIANRCSRKGDGAFPSQLTIAEDTGQGLRSVKRGLEELQRGGWLQARRRGFAKGNYYTICRPPIRATPGPSYGPPVGQEQYTEQSSFQEEEGNNRDRGNSPSSDAIRANSGLNEGFRDQEPTAWEDEL